MRYSGYIEYHSETTIRGQCVDHENPEHPVELEILWKGIPIRTIRSSRNSFSYAFGRNSTDIFPIGTFLDVRLPDGRLLERGRDMQPIGAAIDDADVRAKLETGFRFDKWGWLKQPFSSKTADERARFAQGMADFTNYFRTHFDRVLFPHYGSLLGYARGRCFIPHDDDTDMSFISTAPTVSQALDEYFDILEAIKDDGHHVRIVDGGQAKAVLKLPNHIGTDIFLTWIKDDGVIFTYFGVLGRIDKEIKFVVDEMEGVNLNIPTCYAKILSMTYGPGWQIPDPNFRWKPSSRLSDYVEAFREAGRERKKQINAAPK